MINMLYICIIKHLNDYYLSLMVSLSQYVRYEKTIICYAIWPL